MPFSSFSAKPALSLFALICTFAALPAQAQQLTPSPAAVGPHLTVIGAAQTTPATANDHPIAIPPGTGPIVNGARVQPGTRAAPMTCAQHQPSVLICGQKIDMVNPATHLPISATGSMTLPPPFVPQHFTAICVATANGFRWQLDTSGITCVNAAR